MCLYHQGGTEVVAASSEVVDSTLGLNLPCADPKGNSLEDDSS